MTTFKEVDLLYLAHNRLAFTRESFAALLANTDWPQVRRFYVYDDDSRDDAGQWLQANLNRVPAEIEFRRTRFHSPVAVMVDFIRAATAPILAKIDNDVIVPPAWLSQSLAVLDDYAELSFLGIEALNPVVDNPSIKRAYTRSRTISGLGLYRNAAFADSQPSVIDRWFGFEEWQAAQRDHLVCGWIDPALPIFLLDRLPFDPWQRYTRQYVSNRWQRAWQAYSIHEPFWQWHGFLEQTHHLRVEASAPAIAGALRIKNEARHIHEVLTAALHLCDRIFVFDDHSEDDTAAICRSFGDRVVVLSSPFQGLDEARDKNYLLRHVIDASSDWVFWIDGDEVLERTGPAKIRQSLARANDIGAYSLRISYLWNDSQTIRTDGIFGQFYRPSLFRLRGQPADDLHFPTAGNSANFHCGNVPRGIRGAQAKLNVRLKHYGYMEQNQREAKYRWYNQNDPNNVNEDYYRHIGGVAGARFAPGPPHLTRWIE